MREAVIVSTARTGMGKSVRGSFNQTHGAVMGGHAVKTAIAKAGIDPGEVEDVIMGCGMPEGATGNNIARESLIWAGCPVTTAGITVNRYCSSGLNAIAFAKFGGKFVVRGGAFENPFGTARKHNVVIEFPSPEAAADCYKSAEYQTAAQYLKKMGDVDLVIGPGYEGPQPA